tara:strand:- start:2342 stop:2491 length:150 start_codon:yes stop_codon:yes gene_type:complete
MPYNISINDTVGKWIDGEFIIENESRSVGLLSCEMTKRMELGTDKLILE